jgi:basic amino acid/polyamine antiporter, APA family
VPKALDVREDARGGAGRQGELRRAIGPGMLFFFVLGDVLGGGIYALVGEVGREVGGAFWTAFALAFVLALLTAASYAELITKYPKAGGAAYFVHRAFARPWLTFMVGFAVLCSGVTSASALARAFAGDYLGVFTQVPAAPVAIAFLVVLAAVNAHGIKESVAVNVGLTVVELAGLLAILVIAGAAIADGLGEPSRALEFDGRASPVALAVAGASVAFYALIGFEDSANVAEEARDPTRAYPRALFGALGLAALIYVLVAAGASIAVPTNELAASSGPLLEVVERGPIAVDPRAFAAIALVAVANGALLNMIMASRLLLGLAREGVVPRFLAHVSPSRRTPMPAIVLTTGLAIALATTGDLGTLARTTVTLLLAVFVIVNASVLVLRRERVDHRHLRVPAAVPLAGAVVSIALLTQPDPGVLLRAGALLALGLVLWLLGRGAATAAARRAS